MKKRIVFMGTPEFAVPSLKALLAYDGGEVVGVVTQPDRPGGRRGKKIVPPPVKVTAQKAGVPVLQPQTLRDETAFSALANLQPDLIVVAAFGQILRRNVLQLPPHRCLNVHASILPRWRGAAPIASAILAGDAETGVTIMQVARGLDTGPMVSKTTTAIRPDHTRASLTAELAQLGAQLLVETLADWFAGQITPTPQDEAQATHAPMLQRDAGQIDWLASAEQIERQVRAFDPWPGTSTMGPRGKIKILAVELAPTVENSAPGGTVFKANKQLYVTTGTTCLKLVSAQPGKKPISGADLVNGQPEIEGYRFNEAS